MARPRIGIPEPGRAFNPTYFMINVNVFLAGGRPCKIKKTTSLDEAFDGILLGGGTDVFPELYRQQPNPDYHYDRERDAMEIRWLTKAKECGWPVFAICRGAQMMNVMNGGSLHMKVSEAYTDAIYPSGYWHYLTFRKTMNVAPGTRLEQVLGVSEYRVNSLHKQSIAEPGEDLVVSGQERNGVVQAIERPAHPFYLGVQFHPELMPHRKLCRALFQSFVESCKKRVR